MTDHRIGVSVHNLEQVMEGRLDDMIQALRMHYQSEALRSGGDNA